METCTTWDFFHAFKTEASKAFTPILQEVGLSDIQAGILMEAGFCDTPTVCKLAEHLHANQGNLSATCKKMEQMGLLIRKRSTKDERVVTPELTELGRQKARQLKDKLDSMFLNHATPEQLQVIIKGSNEMLAVLKKINNSSK
ncbi:MAG: MarR family winged helix-turn-helix transcriptional regulator [Oscillospiraceae bacterium]|nr:MarR family winged helix-turn-helix transcriptional regulator [Oscillospiraceae bacterium]